MTDIFGMIGVKKKWPKISILITDILGIGNIHSAEKNNPVNCFSRGGLTLNR